MRRKSNPVAKSSSIDDKKLEETARKGGLQQLPQFDEANIFLSDESVLQIKSVRVFATMQHEMAGNTLILVGNAQTTSAAKLMPDLHAMSGGAPPGMGQLPDLNAPASFEAIAEDQD